VTFLHKLHSFALFEVNCQNYSVCFYKQISEQETTSGEYNQNISIPLTVLLFPNYNGESCFVYIYNTIQKVRRILVKTAQRDLDVSLSVVFGQH
jgi:hypothetical protein